jgi:hypothetical protein
MLFATTANHLWENDFKIEGALAPTVLFGARMAAVLLYGGVRTSLFRPDAERTLIAGITNPMGLYERKASLDSGDFETVRSRNIEEQAYFFEKTRHAAKAGAKLALWQEWALFVQDDMAESSS